MKENKNKKKGKLHKNNKLNDLTGSEWIQLTKSWFILHPKQRKDKEFTHPAKFPEELAERYISFFTKKGEAVLDPFAGISSTLIACENLNRRGIGIEYVKKYADIGRRRLDMTKNINNHIIINDNSQKLTTIWKNKKNNLPEKVSLILTSPPYWNMLGESRGNVLSAQKKRQQKGLDTKYSNGKEDLGNIKDYQEFLKSLGNIFDQGLDVLKGGGHMVVVLQNLRVKEGYICTPAWDLVKVLENNWKFIGEQIWLQDNKPLGIWGYPSSFVSNIHHHYCLIFQPKTGSGDK